VRRAWLPAAARPHAHLLAAPAARHPKADETMGLSGHTIRLRHREEGLAAERRISTVGPPRGDIFGDDVTAGGGLADRRRTNEVSVNPERA